MRLETLNPFGQISVLLVKQGGKILFYNLMENKYMLTDDKSPILKEVLGVPISLEEVKSILLQDFFTGASNPFRKNPVTEKEEGGFRVEYTRHVKEFYLNRDGMVGSVGFFDLSGKPLFVASYSRYVRVSDLLFPSKIGVTFPAEGIKLLFSLRDVSVNREIEPDLFVLDLPEKAVRYR